MKNRNNDKPKYLYHASVNKQVEVFEPRDESVRDENEGKVVFATPSKTYASMFIVSAKDSWVISGRYGDRFWIIINDKKRYLKKDQGGAIYKLPADKFSYHSNKGAGCLEWISKESVEVISKEIYSSGLDAMLKLEVEVYFVNKETFDNFKKAEKRADHGEGFLDKLEPEK